MLSLQVILNFIDINTLKYDCKIEKIKYKKETKKKENSLCVNVCICLKNNHKKNLLECLKTLKCVFKKFIWLINIFVRLYICIHASS